MLRIHGRLSWEGSDNLPVPCDRIQKSAARGATGETLQVILTILAQRLLAAWQIAPSHAVSSYIMVYAGPPPPSGTVHWMFWEGSLMSQALQCRTVLCIDLQPLRAMLVRRILIYPCSSMQLIERKPVEVNLLQVTVCGGVRQRTNPKAHGKHVLLHMLQKKREGKDSVSLQSWSDRSQSEKACNERVAGTRAYLLGSIWSRAQHRWASSLSSAPPRS